MSLEEDFSQRAVGRVFQAEGTAGAKAKESETPLGNCKKLLLGNCDLGLPCARHRGGPQEMVATGWLGQWRDAGDARGTCGFTGM